MTIPLSAVWVYGTMANAREFHLLSKLEEARVSDWRHTDNMRAWTPCSSNPRYQFALSVQPPEHLQLCDKCALLGYKAWVVYRCYAGETLLYVGVTDDLVARLDAHRRYQKTSSKWWPLHDRIEADIYDNAYVAGAAEREAIARLQPAFNTTYKRQRAAAV